jgi:glycyl-tRNA synthetase beta chain
MEFLLEINTEEMPRSHVEGALDQLKTGLETRLVAAGLVKNRGFAGKMEVYGTCRRLILVADVIPRQKDTEESLIGPPRAAAFKPDGTPGPAALGFARSRGVAVEDLEVITTEKGEYIGVRKVLQGRSARDILIGAIPDLISRLAFPKMMRWSDNPFRFSRPIKRILCLLDGRLLPFRVGGIQSGDHTMGHRLYSLVVFKVSGFKQVNSELRRNKVIISLETRKTRIINQIHKQLEPLGAAHYPDESLLNKLAMDVEYPYVFSGSFPESFLKLPIEVLSTAMREGQNLFSVVKVRKQLPFFVGVADGCSDARGLVRKGNERVLKARLEDARFFWENDLKTPLKQRRADLSNIVFQEKLGSYADKSERIRKLAAYLVGKLAAGRQRREITTAADLCKTDLLTEMVREFPSLQGKAGGLYARKEGFPNVVWKGIY